MDYQDCDFGMLYGRREFKSKVSESLHERFNHLYSHGLLFDLTVTIGDETFECHRFMLAAASDFFKASLTSPWCESSSRLVRLDHCDVTPDSFRHLLDILYKGEDVVTMTTAQEILKMAIFLQIKFLQDDVKAYLSDNMSADTCIGIWKFGEKYDLTQLAQKAADLAVAQFDRVSKCQEFLDIPKSFLLVILSSVKSSTSNFEDNAVSMDCLFYGILRWVEVDADSRKTHLPELLPFVCFPQLTPACLNKAVTYLNHPLRDFMFDYVEEALSYNLIGKIDGDKVVQRQILARQNKVIEVPDMERHVVLVGGVGGASDPKKMLELLSFPIGSLDSSLNRLKPAPHGLGVNFATCVWRNELYVSGGFDQSRLFAVYKPGDNQWDILPLMLKGREKHCMAALNWNVYVIGGLEQGCLVEKVPASDVVVYSVKKKTWTHFGRLTVAVLDTTTAVLGHRIYVFGGQDAGGNSTDMVQCIDTLSGHVYTAGRLPAPSSRARAVSDGGTIYIATPQGTVLKMKENFFLADEREREKRVLSDTSPPAVEGEEKPSPATLSPKLVDINEVVNGSCYYQEAQPHGGTKTHEEEREATALSYASSVDVKSTEKHAPLTLSPKRAPDDEDCDKQKAQPLDDNNTQQEEEKVKSSLRPMVAKTENGVASDSMSEADGTPEEKREDISEAFQEASGISLSREEVSLKSHDDQEETKGRRSKGRKIADSSIDCTELELGEIFSHGKATNAFNDPSPTVSFDTIGQFPPRQDFGTYLHNGELVVCGGKKHNNTQCHDQMGVRLKTGRLSHKQQTLVNGRSGFGVHVLHIPREFLTEEYTYSQGTMRFFFPRFPANTERTSNKKTVGKFQWFIMVRLGKQDLQLYLCMVTDQQRNENVIVHFTAKLLSATNASDKVRSLEYVFSDQQDSSRGWNKFASDKELDSRFSGEKGEKVMIEYTIIVQ